MTSFIGEQKLSKATRSCVKKQSPYLPDIDVVTVNHNLIQLTENYQLPGIKYLIIWTFLFLFTHSNHLYVFGVFC